MYITSAPVSRVVRISRCRLGNTRSCRRCSKVRVRDTRLFLEDPVLHVDDDQRRPTGLDRLIANEGLIPTLHVIRVPLPVFRKQGSVNAIITGKLSCSRLSDLQPFCPRPALGRRAQGIRIHDLRHTFASAALAAGQGLPIIGNPARAYAGGDDRPLRSSRGGSGEGGKGAGVVGNRFLNWDYGLGKNQ